MFPPLAILATATLAAAVVAYGMHPDWAYQGGGLALIMFTRRWQWPLVALSLILCVVLIALVVSGRRRAWWLIGLAPVLALFGHRFAKDPSRNLVVLDLPAFVSADEAGFLRDDDYVVGAEFEGTAYAYPYALLHAAPVVLQADHDKRLLVMWSAPANRAVATTVTREVKGRDLEVVTTPANALLLYNSRLGEFIVTLTGRAPDGRKPAGFGSTVPTARMPWAKWRAAHADTKVMAPPGGVMPAGPTRPLAPLLAPASPGGPAPADRRVVLVGGARPVAVAADAITAAPLNTKADGIPVFIFRDPGTGEVRAFDRRVDGADLTPTFRSNGNPGQAGAMFVDPDTGTGWDAVGVAVTGRKEYKGRRLAHVPVEDDLSWGVMKFWYPDLRLVSGAK